MTNIWKANIYNAIKGFAAIDLQKKMWLGKDINYASSFSEDYAMLIDSYALKEFLDEKNWDKTGLSRLLQNAILGFMTILESYEEKENDAAILADPQWLKIVEEAKKVIILWDKECKLTR